MNASVSHCLNEAFVVALDGVWNRFLATIYVCCLTCTIVIILLLQLIFIGHFVFFFFLCIMS